MKIRHNIFSAALVLLPFVASARVTENFDANWNFLEADATGAETNNFDDSNWQKLNLPHDWSIAGPFSETNKTGGAGAFLPSGVGWYRKHFTLPETDSGKSIAIEFDGVMANSDVWINGFHLGHRPNGYVSFSYELTGHLNFGGDNIVSVRADTSAQPASRWYSGAGIYRHVRLVTTDPIRIAENGVFISTPEASATQATVHVQCTVTNESDSSKEVFVQVVLLDPDGKILDFTHAGMAATISQTLAAGKSTQVEQNIVITNPQLWNLDKPVLYCAVVTVYNGVNRPLNLSAASDIQKLDVQTNIFGIRDAHFEADTGFWLNGKNFKIKGVCLHADGGAFGAAIPLSIWATRLTTLKSLGVNAIRTAHNPPAPEFLDLCDRLGFLVMDEFFDCWTVAKNPYDYHLYFDNWWKTDERDAILRDRNHPSVIIYSVGNEIHDTPQAEKAKRILKGLVETAHADEYRDWWRRGRFSTADWLGRGNGASHFDASATVHDHLFLDSAAFLGAGAVCEDRLRQGGHSDAAGGGGRACDAAADPRLFGAAGAAVHAALPDPCARWRGGRGLWHGGSRGVTGVPGDGGAGWPAPPTGRGRHDEA